MPSYTLITPERFSNRRWRRYRAMPFAAVEEARLGELFGDDEEVLSFDL